MNKKQDSGAKKTSSTIYEKASLIISQQRIKLSQVTLNRDNLDTYYFDVKGNEGDYKVSIWEQVIGETHKQKILRWNCDCHSGSIVSPKYNTICPHVAAGVYFLILERLEEQKKGDKKT
jgi:hypothetical protein